MKVCETNLNQHGSKPNERTPHTRHCGEPRSEQTHVLQRVFGQKGHRGSRAPRLSRNTLQMSREGFLEFHVDLKRGVAQIDSSHKRIIPFLGRRSKSKSRQRMPNTGSRETKAIPAHSCGTLYRPNLTMADLPKPILRFSDSRSLDSRVLGFSRSIVKGALDNSVSMGSFAPRRGAGTKKQKKHATLGVEPKASGNQAHQHRQGHQLQPLHHQGRRRRPELRGFLTAVGLMWLWIKNRYPKWLALVSGNMDQNLQSNSWWLNFDPYPC